jgi:hypothetical protein
MMESLGPMLEPGYAVPCVDNLADEKFCVLSEVSHTALPGTIVHRLTKSIPNSHEIIMFSYLAVKKLINNNKTYLL